MAKIIFTVWNTPSINTLRNSGYLANKEIPAKWFLDPYNYKMAEELIFYNQSVYHRDNVETIVKHAYKDYFIDTRIYDPYVNHEQILNKTRLKNLNVVMLYDIEDFSLFKKTVEYFINLHYEITTK